MVSKCFFFRNLSFFETRVPKQQYVPVFFSFFLFPKKNQMNDLHKTKTLAPRTVDYEEVQYHLFYDELQSRISRQDPRVDWMTATDRTTFSTNLSDMQLSARIIQQSDSSWWETEEENKAAELIPNTPPYQPLPANNNVYFTDYFAKTTELLGFGNVNKQSTLLQWLSRMLYFSPIYQLLYPIILFLIGFLVAWSTGYSGGFFTFLTLVFSSFWKRLTGETWTSTIMALVQPTMYCVGLYESIKTRSLHHSTLIDIWQETRNQLLHWKCQFDFVSQFCRRATASGWIGNDSCFFQNILQPFQETHFPFFQSLFQQHSSLLSSQTFEEHYPTIGTTLVLRYHLSDGWSQLVHQLRNLQSIASKVAKLRLWHLANQRFQGKIQTFSSCSSVEEEKLESVYYPFLVVKEESELQGNDCRFGSQNIVVTGPNATGKTTFLKSVMLNLMLVQHVGVGFFESCSLHLPFHHFSCYINIPDTSDRESLFQAEATRALSIAQCASKANDRGERTLAIFDELFTGTNPTDAAAVTKGMLRYLDSISGLRFLTTTHFGQVIEEMQEEDQQSQQHKEETKEEGEEIESSTRLHYFRTGFDSLTQLPTFRLEHGVSKRSNVLQVLTSLHFPSLILDFVKG
jgi:hypothetical protein